MHKHKHKHGNSKGLCAQDSLKAVRDVSIRGPLNRDVSIVALQLDCSLKTERDEAHCDNSMRVYGSQRSKPSCESVQQSNESQVSTGQLDNGQHLCGGLIGRWLSADQHGERIAPCCGCQYVPESVCSESAQPAPFPTHCNTTQVPLSLLLVSSL